MNYKALEDLVNILVKKAGYSVNETVTTEDIEILTRRVSELKEAKVRLDSKIKSDNYIDLEDKNKDLEEKKYLESILDILTRQAEEGPLSESEVDSLREQVKYSELKIESKSYNNKTSRAIDEMNMKALDEEIDSTNDIIEKKLLVPSALGLTILDAFKEGKTFDQIKDVFDLLVSLASEENKKTVSEIKDTNIFALMEEYSKDKDAVYKRIQKDNYSDKDVINALDEKSRYHRSRINSYNKTIDAIEGRKKELSDLIEESKVLYEKTRSERLKVEELLNDYTSKLYSSNTLSVYENEFNKYLDYLKDELLGDKVLEDKYNKDVLGYKEELRNLEINAKNLNTMILEEENCLGVIDSKLDSLKDNNIYKINDEIDYLMRTNRLENLTNEQQYFYVNVDTIRNEIINIWSKGNNSASYEESYDVNEEEDTEEIYDLTSDNNSFEETEEAPVEEIVEEETPEEVVEEIETPLEEETPEVVEPVENVFDTPSEETNNSVDEFETF